MSFDPSACNRLNVADSCSVWNLCSSSVLWHACRRAGYHFSITAYVLYELIHKVRRAPTKRDLELRERFLGFRKDGCFLDYPLDISDLQTPEAMAARERMDKGELTSVIFAQKTRQAFLSDDKKARNKAQRYFNDVTVQSIPHITSNLFFDRQLLDGDISDIIVEHTSFGRGLGPHLTSAHEEAMRCRLMISCTPEP